MSPGRHYSTDITAEQWELLTPLLPQPKWHPGGLAARPMSCGACSMAFSTSPRRVASGACCPSTLGIGIPSIVTSGSYFRAWRRTGLWARLLEQLRQRERRRLAALRQPEEGSRDVQGIGQGDKARRLPLKDRGDKALAASLRVRPRTHPPLWLDRVTWEEESQPPFSSLGAKAGREVPPGPQRTRAL
jgi:transposase